MKNFLVPMLVASAGGASAFVASPSFTQKTLSQNTPAKSSEVFAQQVGRPDLSLSASQAENSPAEQDPKSQKRAEQLAIYRKIYDKHGYSNLNQGIEFFYQKDGEFSEDKLNNKSFTKDAEKMHQAFGHEAYRLKEVTTFKSPDRFEGDKIAHKIVKKMAMVTQKSEADADFKKDMGLYQEGAKQLLESAAYYGLKVNAKNKEGNTPAQIAQDSGNPELAEYIDQMAKSQKKVPIQDQIGGKVTRELYSGMQSLERKIRAEITPNLQRYEMGIRHSAQRSADSVSSFAQGVKQQAINFKDQFTGSFVEGYLGEADSKNESFVDMVNNSTSSQRRLN